MSDEKNNNGGPAFPQHGWSKDPDVLDQMKNQGGMTLRDYFAAQAVQSIFNARISLNDGLGTKDDAMENILATGLSEDSKNCDNENNPLTYAEDIAYEAYIIADAMIAMRDAK